MKSKKKQAKKRKTALQKWTKEMSKTRYAILLRWSVEDSLWIAEHPELPAVYAHGDTKKEARRELKQAFKLFIECEGKNATAQHPPLHFDKMVQTGKSNIRIRYGSEFPTVKQYEGP